MAKPFKRPSTDDSVLIPHWVHYDARHNAEHPLFVYADANTELKTITFAKAAHGFGRAARIVASLKVVQEGDETPEVIGLLANLDSITYYTLLMGTFMAGCTPFPISTRNSPAAVAHLLKKTGTHKLFVSPDEHMQKIASAARASAEQDGHSVELLSVPTFQRLYPESPQDEDLQSLPVYPQRHLDSPGFILHSSGSTSFPKPVTQTHRILKQISQLERFRGVNGSQVRMAAHSLPPFHAMALFPFIHCLYAGQSISCFPPRSPPVVPSPKNVLDAAVATKCHTLYLVPLFIEVWSRNPDDVEKLKTFHRISFSGGPLNKLVGDELSQKGVKLSSFYAGTEMGLGSIALPKEANPDWDWHASLPDGRMVFVPQDDPEIFELVFVETPIFTPAVFNSEVDGKRAFATNDLAIRHPADPSKFQIYGRKDDQLMLSTGEKTNPGPLEAIICKDPLVNMALMFGRGRAQNGILIQPAKGHEIDPMDTAALARFRNDIWPSVEKANEYAPTHSRLYKEMILVAHPSKPFETTAKLAPRRPAVLQAYKDEIEAAYVAVEESTQTGIPPPSEWTAESVLTFVRDTVLSIMDEQVGDDDDIFVHGGDSLKATYIRNSLARALRQTHKEPASGLPQSFVYSNPSIALLARQLLAFVDPSSVASEDAALVKLKDVDEMVAEYTSNFPQHKPSGTLTDSSGEVVLITGTTGALGVEILGRLVSLPDVSHVYAFNRPAKDKSLRIRQAESLVDRGLDPSIIDSPKVTLVEGDTATKDLGIEAGLYEKIRDSVTLIIANAWRVNFNLALGSFRPVIQGVRNLVDFALQSSRNTPPRIIFSSSVNVFRNWKGPGRPPEASVSDPHLAMSQGYGASKFVAERILERAASQTSLRPVIVRIGQMTGNASGAWNSGDWVPAIVRSGQVLGVLPARDVLVDWIPIHTAAQVLVEFRTSKYQHLHLFHPNPVSWNSLFDDFSSLLKVPLVRWNEWMPRLEKYQGSPQQNPAILLVDFFRRTSAASVGDVKGSLPDVTKARQSSPSLADPSLPQLGRGDVERWVAYWKRRGPLVE